jgi:hypothetical protein
MERESTVTDQPGFVVPPHVLHREVDGQMVLLNLDSEQYFGLDEIGAHIVARLTSEPFDSAIAGLIDTYDVDPDVLRADVRKLVEDLVASGLLQPAGSPG